MSYDGASKVIRIERLEKLFRAQHDAIMALGEENRKLAMMVVSMRSVVLKHEDLLRAKHPEAFVVKKELVEPPLKPEVDCAWQGPLEPPSAKENDDE